MTHMFRRWLGVLAIATAVNCPDVAHATTAMGVPSCGQWIARKNSVSDKATSESWLLGYLSGLATGTRVDILRDTDYDSLIAWMDNYCNTHPLERVSGGAAQLYIELQGRVPK
ncbi:hypothetical protein SAMN05192539_1010142 [Paraburkholderia diazotrophica]|uniref:HdeA/HdeB family protein n=1 Tax=Paraburkholderia diazotrophica TaxID=667676 RepID=A0A1H6YVA0_9BURK|nr:hypothetical protein SAMN05192539_1010142 [Paraburkholderia diazotrophica]